MIELIVILATILLFLLLTYPSLIRLYRIYHLGKKQMEKETNKDQNRHINSESEASIVGKSTFNLCQPLPITTTLSAKEAIIENDDHTFAMDSDPAPMDIDYALERDTDDGINEEEETIELEEMFGKDVCYASGINIDELYKIKQVIELPDTTQNKQQEVGRILYENQETEIVEQLSSGKTGSIISNLIDLHILSHQKEINEPTNISESEELENFDVNKFLNSK